ncbi:MAG: glycerol-3-phosphate dehydrogenase/oxidase [Hydrocarboniphaga sp.]|uniref:glycerol-3-phosphate dehydrogenase/oxidase n=1 Tax=Hydrocarboniphaga sp. TaxID=2033016 RepID=UPI0026369F7C|nr:glycerol-3-phosphate dehydrogenase/oxidase [Hydrocarboniphaga sp.]MDB5969398.1 glycerol-3-phosphate dehydrogenase/oxidase [Hydrocarboniphaga sp.]
MPHAYPLVRDVPALQNSAPFDLLVIGGGIYGAWTAYDAALRGLKVALVEKSDWGSGTSSASSKLIHGGLRYLEHFEFQLVRHALAERRVLTDIAPHLVRPLRFMVPVWKGARVGMFQMSAGLTLYDFLAGRDQPVARHKSYSKSKLLRLHPYLREAGLKGGLSYGDCQEDDARMTLAVVAAAQQAGVVVANRVAATRLLKDGDRIVGATLHDLLGDTSFDLRAAAVVAAAGPWAQALIGREAPKVKLVKGVHLVMPAIPGCSDAFLFTAPQDGRVYFVIPWYGRTLLGTTESEVSDPKQAVVTGAEVAYLLEAARAALPQLGWTEQQVQGRFAGVRTLQADEEDSLSAVTREFVVLQPSPGLVLPIGGKYTTSRVDAIEIVDAVMRTLGRGRHPSTTHDHPLPGAPPARGFDAWLVNASTRLRQHGVDAAAAIQLALRHGQRVERIAELLVEQPAWSARVVAQAEFIDAEIVLAAREEMCFSLDDLLRRRMPLTLLTPLAKADLQQIATLFGEQLKWTADQRQLAVDEMRSR